jgi:anaerobic ribonucleoside-triphosphate reductase activating protein
MLKYVNTDVVFQEIPNETTLAINISNCPCHCKGCHSSYLAGDIGTELTAHSLLELLKKNKGITCVAMMGGDSEPQEVEYFSELVRNIAGLRYAWYSGRQELPKNIDISKFNYIKLGPYIEELGGLKSPTTNQRLYEVKMCKELDEKGNPIYGLEDITEVFWK